MISPGYIRHMAQYNTWQNSQLLSTVDAMDAADLSRDRGAFFGSILGTLNHLLWGDMLWLSRFAETTPPAGGGIADSAQLWPDAAAWAEARRTCDAAIQGWADSVTDAALEGDLSWYSGVLSEDVQMPKALCIVHFFNHQTHHRGQVHAMLTAAGHDAPVSDLIFMPGAR